MHVCFVGFWWGHFLARCFGARELCSTILLHLMCDNTQGRHHQACCPYPPADQSIENIIWECPWLQTCWATCCKCQWYWYALGLPSKACSKPSSQARCEDFNPAIPCLILSRFSPFRRRGCLFRPWRCRAVVPFHWLRIFQYWMTVTRRASNSALLKPRNDSMTSKTIQRAQEIEAMPVIPVVVFFTLLSDLGSCCLCIMTYHCIIVGSNSLLLITPPCCWEHPHLRWRSYWLMCS